MLKRWLISLVLLACQWPAVVTAQAGDPAADPASVTHVLGFPDRNNQYVQVRSVFQAQGDSLHLYLPSWTPGSYLIRDFATNLEKLRASDAGGKPLNIRKLSTHHWQVESGGARRVTVEYDVWAGRRNVSESWVEAEFGLLNGAGIFLYSEQTSGLPQIVRIQLPEGWGSIQTSLEKTGTDGEFIAVNYDELVDSPILAGNPVVYDFEVNRHPYSLVMLRENPLWDGKKAADDVAEIVRAQQDFWGVNPFDRRYLFLNLYMDKFGGLEHDHSTVMMCSPWQMRGKTDYIKWLGLVSHEFFHSWNVRRMRPQALVDYDYSGEVHTRELWLAEGLTSYYDNLLLFRAGLIDVGDYFELLAEEMRKYETTPGRTVRSAELASFDTWIKHYKEDPNKVNSTVSYYVKGGLIGFVTDMEIRRATNSRESLDTVMRAMYSQYGPRESGLSGYPPGAFEHQVESVAGPAVRKTVEEMLQTTADPHIDESLAWFGLNLQRAPLNDNGEDESAGIGVKWQESAASLFAEYVVRGYPAAAAGVLPGDELLAVNGFRVAPDNYLARFLKLKQDEQVDLTLVRDGRLLTVSMVTGPEIPDSYVILPDSRINNREKQRMEAWLGRELQFR
jgi:predicted metalloprotease with PDZ domain